MLLPTGKNKNSKIKCSTESRFRDNFFLKKLEVLKISVAFRQLLGKYSMTIFFKIP